MENSKIAIIDYGIGNLYSVLKACEKVGLNAFITNDKKEIQNSDALILPGVGAFSVAMKSLNDLDLAVLLKDYAQTNKPLMGVCLGMQLLLEESEEFGTQKGLGIIEGSCERFPNSTAEKIKIRVPQIMWNTIYPPSGDKFKVGTPLEDIKANEYMYFVHSFYATLKNEEHVLSKTSYQGIEYCSSLSKNNVVAFQFHPEKSGTEGIRLYQKFKDLINKNNKNDKK